MHLNIAELARQRVLVGDGAMGTELMKLGWEPGDCPESWNIEKPSQVRAITASYVAAGADFVHTNTLGANRWKLEHYGLAGSLAEINAAGVRIAREAAKGRAFVVAEIGPTGRFMAPLGTDSREAFLAVFYEQAKAVADAGADAALLETFTALDEALAALEACRKAGLPVIASMSYDLTANAGYRTIMGNDIPSSSAALAVAGADVISANCAMGPDGYLPIAKALCAATSLPVMIQPNAGMPQLVDGKTIFPMSPSEMAKYAVEIVKTGVRIFGGCCGTTPEHIAAIKAVLSGTR